MIKLNISIPTAMSRNVISQDIAIVIVITLDAEIKKINVRFRTFNETDRAVEEDVADNILLNISSVTRSTTRVY